MAFSSFCNPSSWSRIRRVVRPQPVPLSRLPPSRHSEPLPSSSSPHTAAPLSSGTRKRKQRALCRKMRGRQDICCTFMHYLMRFLQQLPEAEGTLLLSQITQLMCVKKLIINSFSQMLFFFQCVFHSCHDFCNCVICLTLCLRL